MSTPKTKFIFKKEDILKRIYENPEFYNNRDNAVGTYNLVVNNYRLIEFKSISEQVDFDSYIDELKKVIFIESKEIFIREFAKVTLYIASYLRKSIA